MSFEPKSAIILEGAFSWAQHAPHASLAPWISSYWTLRTHGPHIVRTLPDSCVDLTLQLAPEPRAYVAAPDTRASCRTTPFPVHLVGARLLPGTAASLGIAVDTLADGWTPLDAFLPHRVVARLLRDVTSVDEAHAQIAVLDAFFAAHVLNRALDPRLGSALREVFARCGDVSIDDLARHSGAHTRTLGRLFDRAVGLSPKRFARVVRLQAALGALPAGKGWTRVALDLGYSDQAHFIRETRELFGTTPGEMTRLASVTM
jgi:AraC-like DNA-binding protein